LSDKLLLSYDEAVLVLGISRRTLQDLVNDGDIKVIRPRPLIVKFPRTELERWIESMLHRDSPAELDKAHAAA